MAKKRNIIVGQSGGPTSVINSSLAGVYKNAIERGFDKVYGMLHGVQGLLDEQYVDLSTQIHSELDIELLKRTPSAFLGSCRYKLPEIHEDRDIYEKLFGILNKLSIDTFIYIGGNDSMDTIKKLSDYAILTGQKQKFIGVPKTIDNDLALTDHTPGFGSAAKYIRSLHKRGDPRCGRSDLQEKDDHHYGDHGSKRWLAYRGGCSCKNRGLRRPGSYLSSGNSF